MALQETSFLSVVNFTKQQFHNLTEQNTPKPESLCDDFSICVVGASSGIGRGIAIAFAQAHVKHILIASRDTAALQDVSHDIKLISPGSSVYVRSCDVGSTNSVQDLAIAAREEMPQGLDCVISVPATSPPFSRNILDDDPAEFQQTFAVNTGGLFNVAHAFIPLLLGKPNGMKLFLTVASIGATLTQGFAAQPAYNISKLAQIRLTEQIAVQFTNQSLTAISIHPGSVLTKMSKEHCPPEYWNVLRDDVSLCGGVCWWIAVKLREHQQQKNVDDKQPFWLNGRFVSSNWDLSELEARTDEILSKDLLKFKMNV